MPTVKFALLLLVMLMTALLGDLILLPAILAGPAGILFRLKKDAPEGSSRVIPGPHERVGNGKEVEIVRRDDGD